MKKKERREREKEKEMDISGREATTKRTFKEMTSLFYVTRGLIDKKTHFYDSYHFRFVGCVIGRRKGKK